MLYSIDQAALFFIWILANIYTCYAATDYKIIEVDQAELIKNAPDFMTRPSTNDNRTIEGVRNLNSSEPFIFIVHQTERWNTNSQRLFEQEFSESSQGSQDKYDYVLKGRTLGVYFYTRAMTGIQAEEVWRKHGRYIATVYPYLRLLDKPKDTFQDPSQPETGPQFTPTRNRRHRQRRNISSINRPQLLRNVTPMQKRETLFEESDLAEMRILSQAPGNPPPEHYAFDSAEGHGVHIYMLGSGAQIQHQAFENARKGQQITESIYAGPNGKSGALKDWDSDLSGTGILGKLVGSETGLSRRANVTVVVDNDNNGREGIPLILSALVQIFEAIISREMGSRGVIIIPSRIDDYNSYREKSLASHYISAWLREILFLFGSLSNNILMCSDLPDDSKDDSWPALIDSLGVQNMVLVGGIDTNGDAISQVTQNSPWIYAPSQNISVPSTLGPIGNEYILKSDVALAVPAVAGILATYMSQYPSLSAVDAKHMLRAGAHSRNGTQNGPLVPWNLYMGFSIKSTDENVHIRSVSPSRRSKGEPKHNNIFARKESKHAPKSDDPEHDDDNKDRGDDDDNDGGKNGDDDDDNGDRDEVEDDEGSSDEDWDSIEDMQPSATKKPESSSSTSYGGTVLKVIAPPTLIKTKTETYCEVPTAIEIPKTTTLTIIETKTVRRPATTITETEIQARPDAKTITIVETTTKTLGEEPDPTLVCHDLKDKQGGYKYVGKIRINDYIPTFCAAFDDISKVDRRQGDHTVSFLDKTISHFNLKVIWKDAYRRPTRPQCEKAFREIMDRCPEQTDIAPLKSNPMGWTAGGKWDYKDNSAFEIEVLEPRAKPQTKKWARCKYKAKDGDESKGYIYTIWGYGWGDREPIDNDENSESDIEKFAVDLDSACEGDGVNFDAKDMTGSRYKHSTGPGSVKLAGDEGFRELDKEMEFDVKFWIGPLGGIDAMDCIEDFLSQNNYVMGGKGLPEDYRFFDSGEEQVKCEKG